jgi:hypothetical protein
MSDGFLANRWLPFSMTIIDPAYLEHERKRFMHHDAHRFIRADWRRFVTPGSELAAYYASIERKYRPDQARVPAGSREGGQWTDEGGGGTRGRDDTGGPRGRETIEISAASRKARGHHYVPQSLYEKSAVRDARRI